MLQRRTLISIYATAVILRLFNLLMVDDAAAHAIIEDASIYWDGAANWIDSGFFSVRSEDGYIPQTERMPLYHLFLIPFRLLFGDAVMPVLIAQAFVDATTCVVIARLGGMIDRPTGVVAGLFAAAWFNFILHSSLILTDTLFLFLMSLMLLFAAKFMTQRRLVDAGLVGLCCGLAIMTRTVALLLPVAIAISAPFITRYFKQGWKHGIAAGLIVIIVSALPTAPIVYRNLTQFGTVKLTQQTSTHMLYWIVGISKSLASGRGFSDETHDLNVKLDERLLRLEGPDNKLTEFELADHRMALAREELGAMPVQDLLYGWAYGMTNNLASPAVVLDPRIRALNKNSFYNSNGTNIFEKATNFIVNNDPRYIVWISFGIAGGVLSLILQAYGLIFMARRTFWAAFFGSLFVLYFLLVSGPVGSAKYRLPIEPVLIIFQSAAVVNLLSRLKCFGSWLKSN